MTRTALTIILAGSLYAGPALADGKAVVRSPSPEGVQDITISWRDADTARMEVELTDGYMVARDGKLYSVSNAGGAGQMVMDLSALGEMADMMKQTAGAAAGGQGPGAQLAKRQAASVESLSDTGSDETVAGVNGDLYEIAWTDKTGQSHTDTMVLSADPLVREFNDVFSTLAGVAQSEDPRTAAINAEGRGLLRFGEEFRVVEISDETPPAGAFELPAEPVDLGAMMQGMPKQR